MTPRAEDYTVAWISALSLEYTVACELLDEQYPAPTRIGTDDNCYTFGKIHQHNVVVACLPKGRYGTTAAAVVARDLQSSFPAIKFALMVGIAGGVPRHDLRLGDVVVSRPTNGHGGVLQYDYGKTVQNKAFQETGYLNSPPQILLTALSHLESVHKRQGHKLLKTIDELIQRNTKLEQDYLQPSRSSDRLYKPNYVHTGDACDCLLEIGDAGLYDIRPVRQELGPRVHYGLVACGNQVIKDAVLRDTLVEKHPDLLCFEMESAGLMNIIGCAAIRGICDYSDSHKNKIWQGHAAAAAAAYAKELLSVISGGSGLIHTKKRNIPFTLDGVPVTRKFVGRSQELQMLREALLHDGEQCSIFVLYGSGGMGKTQLAVKFMRDHQKYFDAVFWLNGNTEDSLKRSLALQAGRLDSKELSKASKSYLEGAEANIDVVVKDVLDWLAKDEITNWLVIYDEVDRDPEDGSIPFAYDIQKYLPKADHGSVLITTRLQRLKRLGDSSHELKRVDQATAKLMLNKWIPGDQDEELTLALLERLSGMPLAISQAGAFMEQSSIDVLTYLNLYDRQWEQLAAESSMPPSEYRNRSIRTTWQLSLDAVSERNQFAVNFMVIWSYLDCKDMWFGLLNSASQNSSFAADLAFRIGDIATNELAFAKTMKILRTFSLIEPSTNKRGCSMHPVIRKWLFDTKSKDFADAGILALTIIGLALEEIHDREGEARVLPLAQAICINFLGISFNERDEINPPAQYLQHNTTQKRNYLWTALHNIGNLFQYYDNLMAAEYILKLALAERRRDLADDKEGDIPAILGDLGAVYYHQNKLDMAEDVLNTSYKNNEARYGITNIRTIRSMYTLAWIYGRQGRREQAIDLYNQISEASDRTGEPTTIESMHVMFYLAVLYLEEGDSNIAEELMMAGRDFLLNGPINSKNSNRLLRLQGNLSWVYVLQNRLADAERMLITTLGVLIDEFGANHEDSIRARYQLAGVYFLGNKIEAAEQKFLEIVRGYRQVGVPRRQFSQLGKAFGCLGNLYHIQRRWSEARAIFQEALARGKEINEHSSQVFQDMLLSLQEVEAEQLPDQIDVLVQMRKQPYLAYRDAPDGRKVVELNLAYMRESYRPSFQVFWRLVRRPTAWKEVFA